MEIPKCVTTLTVSNFILQNAISLKNPLIAQFPKFFPKRCWNSQSGDKFPKSGISGCCSLSVGVALKVPFTTNGMYVKSNKQTYVMRTSNNRVILLGDLCCCLLPQSVKLCALAPRASRSQHKKYRLLVFRMPNTGKWPIHAKDLN